MEKLKTVKFSDSPYSKLIGSKEGSGPLQPSPGQDRGVNFSKGSKLSPKQPGSLLEELKLRFLAVSGSSVTECNVGTCSRNADTGSSNVKMSHLGPLRKSYSNLGLIPEEEPYGQLVRFQGINSESLPPLTKLGAARVQAPTESAQFSRLPSTAYNPFCGTGSNAYGNLNVPAPPINSVSSSTNVLENRALSDLVRKRERESRPATATAALKSSFKLPPIDKHWHRGPLKSVESKEKVRNRRGGKKCPAEEPGSGVSKMVKIFEADEQRSKAAERVERKKMKKCSKEGLLDKRFSKVEASTAVMHPEDSCPARLGKIRKMVKMFDTSAPEHRRQTAIDYGLAVLEPDYELDRPSSSSVLIRQRVTKVTRSQLSLWNEGTKEGVLEKVETYGQESQSQLSSGTFSRFPSLYTGFGKKPAWLLGDKIEVQVEVQEKWDVVNNEFRTKFGSGGGSTQIFRNLGGDEEDVDMPSDGGSGSGSSEDDDMSY